MEQRLKQNEEPLKKPVHNIPPLVAAREKESELQHAIVVRGPLQNFTRAMLRFYIGRYASTGVVFSHNTGCVGKGSLAFLIDLREEFPLIFDFVLKRPPPALGVRYTHSYPPPHGMHPTTTSVPTDPNPTSPHQGSAFAMLNERQIFMEFNARTIAGV